MDHQLIMILLRMLLLMMTTMSMTSRGHPCNVTSGHVTSTHGACQARPCVHGVCVNTAQGKSRECYCSDGYTGDNCQHPGHFCGGLQCRNGGVCGDVSDDVSDDVSAKKATCICPPGYTGADCSELIDLCVRAACINGASCVLQSTLTRHHTQHQRYACLCRPGYAGPRCEVDVSVCASQRDESVVRCHNGGVCIDDEANRYHCSCQPGFTGVTCETDIDDCQSAPCMNGATCMDQVNRYTCICPPGYSGHRCDIEMLSCSNNPCHNDAICYTWTLSTSQSATIDVSTLANKSTSATHAHIGCFCRPDFYGRRCEHRYDDCLPTPRCLHGGTCVDRVNDFDCLCPPGTSGRQCQCVIAQDVGNLSSALTFPSITAGSRSYCVAPDHIRPLVGGVYDNVAVELNHVTVLVPSEITSAVPTTAASEWEDPTVRGTPSLSSLTSPTFQDGLAVNNNASSTRMSTFSVTPAVTTDSEASFSTGDQDLMVYQTSDNLGATENTFTSTRSSNETINMILHPSIKPSIRYSTTDTTVERFNDSVRIKGTPQTGPNLSTTQGVSEETHVMIKQAGTDDNSITESMYTADDLMTGNKDTTYQPTMLASGATDNLFSNESQSIISTESSSNLEISQYYTEASKYTEQTSSVNEEAKFTTDEIHTDETTHVLPKSTGYYAISSAESSTTYANVLVTNVFTERTPSTNDTSQGIDKTSIADRTSTENAVHISQSVIDEVDEQADVDVDSEETTGINRITTSQDSKSITVHSGTGDTFSTTRSDSGTILSSSVINGDIESSSYAAPENIMMKSVNHTSSIEQGTSEANAQESLDDNSTENEMMVQSTNGKVSPTLLTLYTNQSTSSNIDGDLTPSDSSRTTEYTGEIESNPSTGTSVSPTDSTISNINEISTSVENGHLSSKPTEFVPPFGGTQAFASNMTEHYSTTSTSQQESAFTTTVIAEVTSSAEQRGSTFHSTSTVSSRSDVNATVSLSVGFSDASTLDNALVSSTAHVPVDETHKASTTDPYTSTLVVTNWTNSEHPNGVSQSSIKDIDIPTTSVTQKISSKEHFTHLESTTPSDYDAGTSEQSPTSSGSIFIAGSSGDVTTDIISAPTGTLSPETHQPEIIRPEITTTNKVNDNKWTDVATEIIGQTSASEEYIDFGSELNTKSVTEPLNTANSTVGDMSTTISDLISVFDQVHKNSSSSTIDTLSHNASTTRVYNQPDRTGVGIESTTRETLIVSTLTSLSNPSTIGTIRSEQPRSTTKVHITHLSKASGTSSSGAGSSSEGITEKQEQFSTKTNWAEDHTTSSESLHISSTENTPMTIASAPEGSSMTPTAAVDGVQSMNLTTEEPGEDVESFTEPDRAQAKNLDVLPNLTLPLRFFPESYVVVRDRFTLVISEGGRLDQAPTGQIGLQDVSDALESNTDSSRSQMMTAKKSADEVAPMEGDRWLFNFSISFATFSHTGVLVSSAIAQDATNTHDQHSPWFVLSLHGGHIRLAFSCSGRQMTQFIEGQRPVNTGSKVNVQFELQWIALTAVRSQCRVSLLTHRSQPMTAQQTGDALVHGKIDLIVGSRTVDPGFSGFLIDFKVNGVSLHDLLVTSSVSLGHSRSPCQEVTCQHGARCANVGWMTAKCHCPPSYTGPLCATVLCTNNHNRSATTQKQTVRAKGGKSNGAEVEQKFGSNFCSTPAALCVRSNENDFGAICRCPLHYSGQRCEQEETYADGQYHFSGSTNGLASFLALRIDVTAIGKIIEDAPALRHQFWMFFHLRAADVNQTCLLLVFSKTSPSAPAADVVSVPLFSSLTAKIFEKRKSSANDTNHSDHVLMNRAAALTPSSGEFFVVALRSGFVSVIWDLGSGRQEVRSEVKLDSKLSIHTLRVGRRNEKVWLQVDAQKTRIGCSGGSQRHLNVANIVYLGGHDSFKHHQLPEELGEVSGFRGCLFDFRIGLNSNTGWPVMPVRGRDVTSCRHPSSQAANLTTH